MDTTRDTIDNDRTTDRCGMTAPISGVSARFILVANGG